MKLRTVIPNNELAYRFGITPGRVSQIFHEWTDIKARELSQLIVWSDRQQGKLYQADSNHFIHKQPA